MLKLDAEGNMLWDNHFGGEANEVGYSVEETSYGGFIVAGHTGSFGDRYQYYLLKTDSHGDLEWEKTFGGSLNWFGTGAIETNDGRYVISGNGPLVHLDSDGNIVWETSLDGSAQCVVPTSDGGYMVTGDDDRSGAVYVAKCDSNGTLLWDKTLSGAKLESGSSIQETADGGYIICGYSESFSTTGKLYISKINQDGNLLWEKIFGDPYTAFGSEATQAVDGGYIAVGRIGPPGAAEGNTCIIKTGPDGNIE